MLTIFSTPKPFRGHSALIQRNAIKSWTLLHPDVEIILFGDEKGTTEVCREYGLLHEQQVERSGEGTKYVNYIFGRAQQIARHDVLCYANCDIVLMQDFRRAVGRVASWSERFLMVGRRWDMDVAVPIDFSRSDWQERLAELARREGFQRLYYNIDYFVFRRGMYASIPPLVIGRVWWDHWLVWKAGAQGAPVVDVSEVVCAIHQNHDYSYHPQGQQGVWYDAAARRNYELVGGRFHLHTIEDANYRLRPQGLEPQRFYWLAPGKRVVREVVRFVRTTARVRVWHPLLNATRPLRNALGLRRERVFPSAPRQEGPRRHPLDV